jgi:hypothetical protein
MITGDNAAFNQEWKRQIAVLFDRWHRELAALDKQGRKKSKRSRWGRVR